jgi:hypothetical protein
MTMQTNNNDRREVSPSTQTVQAIAPARRNHRERDFGVGYGNSSGYVSNRRYSSNAFQPLFRCA